MGMIERVGDGGDREGVHGWVLNGCDHPNL